MFLCISQISNLNLRRNTTWFQDWTKPLTRLGGNVSIGWIPAHTILAEWQMIQLHVYVSPAEKSTERELAAITTTSNIDHFRYCLILSSNYSFSQRGGQSLMRSALVASSSPCCLLGFHPSWQRLAASHRGPRSSERNFMRWCKNIFGPSFPRHISHSVFVHYRCYAYDERK